MKEFTFESLFGRVTRRIVAAVTLFFFTFTFYSPAVHAAYDLAVNPDPEPNNLLENFNPLGFELQALKRVTDTLLEQLKASPGDRDQVNALTDRIDTLRNRVLDQHRQLTDQLATSRVQLRENNVDAEILARHETFAENYQASMSVVLSHAEQLARWNTNRSNIDATIELARTLSNHLDQPVRHPTQSFSNDLDFVDPPPRNILTSLEQVRSLLGVGEDTTWPMDAYLDSDPATRSSERVEDLVNSLGPDPLTLYNWVHDNVDYIPSFGIMQGADYTLQSLQGNAFDISSTYIAMLREAGIPARYQYGVIALPAESVQNWVGGVVNVDAATNLLSQGGIPQRQIGYGGAIEQVEMEHVWVQAYIDGEWVSFDPSFKQYTYDEGLDVEDAVTFDAENFLQDYLATGTRNEDEGWIQGLDINFFQQRTENYQNQLEDYLSATQPDATLEEVLGQRHIDPSPATRLDQVTLPYDYVVANQAVPAIPDSLFHQFKLQVGSTTGGSFGIPVQWGSVLAELQAMTTDLVGKPMSISFRPASAADAQALESYIPDDPSSEDSIPESLPANTIRMVGEIRVDEEIVASTSEVTMGQALMTRLGYIPPERGWQRSQNHLTAGVYQAVGIDMQGISPDQLRNLQDRLANAQDTLSSGSEDDLSSLSQHDLVGNLLQTGIQGYLGETYAVDKIAAAGANIVNYREPSYGTFSTSLSVSFLFGSPQSVRFAGVVMDVDRVSANTESVDNCYEDWLAFNLSSGMRNSAYEHRIPERLFTTDGYTPEGVSTAKALSIALSEGQKVYTLTQENAGQLTNVTIDTDARSEIQDALNQGLEVTVHEQPVTVGSWQGSGYSVLDPEYGVGAYKISGGSSGGVLDDWPTKQIAFGLFVFSVIGSAFALPLLLVVLATILAFVNTAIATANTIEELNASGCPPAMSQLVLAVTVATFLLPFFLPALAVILAASFWGFLMFGAAGMAARLCRLLL